MFVGVSTFTFHLPGSRSLKDKRAIVRSFKDRVQAKFHISVAEVGALDALQRAIIGIAVISNEAALCDEVMANVATSAQTVRDALLIDHKTEIISLGQEGANLEETPFSGRD